MLQRWLKLDDLIIQTFLKLVSVENDWRLFYLLYQLFNYHPEKVPDMNLMWPIVIQKPNQSMDMIKNYFRIKYFKNLGIVLEQFQVCQWNIALWEKRKSLHYQKNKRDITERIMTFSGYLNVYNFRRVLLAARKVDTITLQLYGYFWRKNFLILRDVKTWSHYLGETIRLEYGIHIFYNHHIYWGMQMQ